MQGLIGDYPPKSSLVGAPITTTTPEVSSPLHHVTSTVIISTITPPLMVKDLFGVVLVADSVFSWTTSGNIAAPSGTVLIAGTAYHFIYQKSTGKWYPHNSY